MRPRRNDRLSSPFVWAASALTMAGVAAVAQPPLPPDAIRFFEVKIRPVLHDNCVGCHNDRKPASGLSFETRESILAGGIRGLVVTAGDPTHSRMVEAIEQTGALKMPPGGKLSIEQIADLRHWIELGLPWPETKATGGAKPVSSDHWSFKTPIRYPEPQVKTAGWIRNPIDSFILAKLESEGLRPAPEADKVTLIRRLSLDLLGFPPNPSEVDDFLADRRPGAYERLVEQILASPHYGERWGRHWLDGARYADTNGYASDRPRVMWRYRDWVIDALNRDMPFDRFTVEQLAGDLLPNATLEQKIATGFHRNTMINEEGGIDKEQYRVEAIIDRVSTTGSVFLGLTVGCAQCHDHKYDPISQREFYQLFAFFNSQDEPVINVARAADAPAYLEAAARFDLEKLKLQTSLAARNAELLEGLSVWEKSLAEADRKKLPNHVRAVLAIPAAQRELSQVEVIETFVKEEDQEYQASQRALDLFVATPSKRNPNQYTAMVLRERDTPRKSYVLLGGDFLKRGIEVTPGVPAVLPPLESGAKPNRLALAKWLVDGRNPLTARVMMNRMWQEYFGRGLVKTSEDFGTQGDKPTHPMLLDWLATEFVRQGWSMKSMHRLIVNSATYRQSAKVTPELLERDPEDILLARSPRYREDAEVVRDIALTVSGLLNPEVGGPSVFPPQPAGVTDLSRGNLAWIVETGKDRYRRGIYTFWKRTAPYPAMTVFDAPTAETSTARRTRSDSPMQALTTLNDEVFVESAQALALRVLKEAPPSDGERLRYAFRLCVAREPDSSERDMLSTALRTPMDAAKAKAMLPKHAPAGIDPNEFAAWFRISRVLLNLDETITRE
jgi:hypothetical protein